jgi:hypothetical protein
MRRRLIGMTWCAVMVGLVAVHGSAWAQQKTAKECNDEWTANKASIQASGKKKKDFMAECRGTAQSTTAPAPTAAPAQPAPKATAGTKTAKECNTEWTANKAAIQASGKKKKDFMAECRGMAASEAPATTAPVRPTPSAAKPEPTQPMAPPPSARATPAPTRTPSTGVPAGAGQFASEAEARSHCPGDTVVWANLDSKIYHFNGTRDYGNTKKGAYMCERDTASAGFRAAKNEKHP